MFHTRAIVLSTRLYREHDELISLFTERFGKQIVRARGTRKATSKLAAALHGSPAVECSFVEGKHYPILTSIDYCSVGGTSLDFYGNYFLYAFLALCDDILYEGDKDEQLWVLVSDAAHTTLAGEKKTKKEWLLLYDTWLSLLLQVLGVKKGAEEIERTLVKKIFADTYHRNPYPLEPFVFL